MEKIVDAIFDGEVFRPDEPVDLARNTKVRLSVRETPSKKLKLKFVKKKPGGQPYGFFKYLASLELDGPSDWSTNIDEYLYHGKPFPDE